MQPLNTAARPSSGSTMGWSPRSDRSMILRRRWPSAIRPAACTPEPSGPRRCMASVMRATAATSGSPPSSRISPAIPHIGASLDLRYLAVDRAAAHPRKPRGVTAHRVDDTGRMLGVVFRPQLPPERLRAVAQAAEEAEVAQLWLWEDSFFEGGIASAT